MEEEDKMYSLDIFKYAGIPYSWLTIYIGQKLKFLGIDDISQYATEYIAKHTLVDKDIAQLAYGDTNSKKNVSLLLERILERLNISRSEDSDKYKLELRKWRFCIINNLIKTEKNNEKLLELVAEVYSSFDYPSDMDNFIYYMPIEDHEHDPLKYSLKENQEYLCQKLLTFMKEEKAYILSNAKQ